MASNKIRNRIKRLVLSVMLKAKLHEAKCSPQLMSNRFEFHTKDSTIYITLITINKKLKKELEGLVGQTKTVVKKNNGL